MNQEIRDAYTLWLCSLKGLGSASLYRLWKESGEDPDFAGVWYRMAGEGGGAGMTNRLREILRRGRKESSPQQLMEQLLNQNIHFVWPGNPCYPVRLKNIPDPPFALYFRGRLPEEKQPSIGIVGTRMASPYGREQARRFASELSAGGMQIISGMAKGIDGIVGRGALDESDDSFAVLGCGVDICYPKENRDLYEALCERGGVISEYRPGTEPEARLFPPRNRIISALSDALLVIEARERSGTLITVDCALEQGKDVWAVPGRVCDAKSAGCNELLRQGAGIAVSPEAMLEEMGYRTAETGKLSQSTEKTKSPVDRKVQKGTVSYTELEKCILCALDSSTAQSVDEITDEVSRKMHRSCSFPELLRAMMKLAAVGAVKEIRVGKYISC